MEGEYPYLGDSLTNVINHLQVMGWSSKYRCRFPVVYLLPRLWQALNIFSETWCGLSRFLSAHVGWEYPRRFWGDSVFLGDVHFGKFIFLEGFFECTLFNEIFEISLEMNKNLTNHCYYAIVHLIRRQNPYRLELYSYDHHPGFFRVCTWWLQGIWVTCFWSSFKCPSQWPRESC